MKAELSAGIVSQGTAEGNITAQQMCGKVVDISE
jgi:hypothetical protein